MSNSNWAGSPTRANGRAAITSAARRAAPGMGGIDFDQQLAGAERMHGFDAPPAALQRLPGRRVEGEGRGGDIECGDTAGGERSGLLVKRVGIAQQGEGRPQGDAREPAAGDRHPLRPRRRRKAGWRGDGAPPREALSAPSAWACCEVPRSWTFRRTSSAMSWKLAFGMAARVSASAAVKIPPVKSGLAISRASSSSPAAAKWTR